MAVDSRAVGPLVVLGLIATVPALGQDAPAGSAQPDWLLASSIATSWPGIADPFGLRSALGAHGVTFTINGIADGLADVAGGMRRGGIAQGRVEVVVDADLDTLLGARGLKAHANGYQIQGTGLSRYYVGNLMVTSSIEALPSTRLSEAWFEQKLFSDAVSVRAGQLAADTEFLTSASAGLFINSSFGWPQITASDLPSGGPAYPLSTPGVRVKWAVSDTVSILAAVFNGDPAGPGLTDPQRRDNRGVAFRVGDPPLLIQEAQFTNGGTASGVLPGTAKLGAFEHFGRFDDQRFGRDGLSLADPASDGVARRHSGDAGVYGVLDQQIFRRAGDDPTKGVSLFVRAAAAPRDRNPIDLYVDGGLNATGLVPGRPDDAFGVAAAFSRVSARASALDRDRRFIAGLPLPVRDHELVLEGTYQAQIVPGWSVQPDVQYVAHPGGHVANPRSAAGRAIPDAVVVGVRTTVAY